MIERIFKANDRNGSSCEFELKPPGVGEENEGERQYRIAYSKALVEGIFPREKLRELMREHGMWTDEDDRELKKAVGKIAVFQVELRNAETNRDYLEADLWNARELVRVLKDQITLFASVQRGWSRTRRETKRRGVK